MADHQRRWCWLDSALDEKAQPLGKLGLLWGACVTVLWLIPPKRAKGSSLSGLRGNLLLHCLHCSGSGGLDTGKNDRPWRVVTSTHPSNRLSDDRAIHGRRRLKYVPMGGSSLITLGRGALFAPRGGRMRSSPCRRYNKGRPGTAKSDGASRLAHSNKNGPTLVCAKPRERSHLQLSLRSIDLLLF